MRILLIQNEFALSGAPVCAFALGKYLKDQGHTVFAVAPQAGEQVNMYTAEGIKCVADPAIFQDARSGYNLAKQVDLVICFTTPSYQCVFGAKGAGKPVIFAIHEVDEIGVNWARENLIFRRALDLADYVTFPAESLKKKFSPYMTKDNGVVIPMGFDTIESSTFPKKEGDKFKLLIVGSFEPRKNQLTAIEAVKGLEGVQLTVVGRSLNPAYGNMVVNAAREAGNVEVRGPAPREEILKLINQHDALLLTSTDEVQSLTIPEAYLLRKPVLVSNVGGLAENVEHGKTGYLFNVKDIQEIKGYITSLKGDAELAKSMGKAGYEFVTAKRTSKHYTDAYQSILEKLQ
jgi:glycosyltransferase involved in cell wall biosynthesis